MNARRNIEAVYKLTPLQEGILYHSLESADPALYLGQYSCIIETELDPEQLHETWQQLVNRHAVLRSLFAWRGQKAPLRIVRERVILPWTYEDWQSHSSEERSSRWQAFSNAERRRGFELDQAPLLRAALFCEGPQRYRFSLCYHHLLFDGWSLRLLLSEAAAIYRSLVNNASPDLPAAGNYADFIEWLNQRDWQEADHYWSQTLNDFSTPTPLPLPAPAGSAQQTPDTASSVVTHLSAERIERLQAFARSQHITLNTLFISAWALLLNRYGDTRDVLFGTAWAGRPLDLADAGHTVGLFINTLPTRLQVSETSTGEWLQKIQAQLVAMREYEQTPLVRAQRASQIPAGQLLFESLLVYQAVPDSPAEAAWPVADEQYHEYGNYPLAMLIRPEQSFTITLVYKQQRFARDAVAAMLDHFIILLDNLAADSTALVTELDLLGAAERDWLLNKQYIDINNANESAIELIEHAVQLNPQNPALIQDGEIISYGEFARQAETLSRRLREAGLNSGGFGAVYLPRSPQALIALFAILKTGAAYVPLDPTYPAERTGAVLADLSNATANSACQCVVITDSACLPQLPDNELKTILIDEAANSDSVSATNSDYSDRPLESLAYVMYTSGTTGKPKGVCVSHANLAASLQARRDYYPEAPARFLLLSSLASDSSIAGIFWTLCNGGALVLPRPQEEQVIQRLAELISDQQVTHTLALPSLYGLLLENTSADQLQSLKSVIVAGEACASEVVREHRKKMPKTILYNEYGPSEATVWASVARLDDADCERNVPIGHASRNARLYLLDSQQRLTPRSLPGELYIGGSGVSPGYLGNSPLTEEKFVTLKLNDNEERLYRSGDLVRYREDDQLEFIGRIDHQIKVRGHRVEPEEIERVLVEFDNVTQAAAVLVGDQQQGSGFSKLVAFLCSTGTPPELSVLRDFVKQRLPDFMAPNAFVFIEALPLTPGGKVDRQALALRQDLLADTSQNRITPRNDIERTLAAIWQDVLGLTAVGVNENFFDLGGDSLLSIRILARAQREGLEISPVDFFARPSIAEQATVATRREAKTADAKTSANQTKPEARRRKKFALANLDNDALKAIANQLDDT